ncbi:acyltransferase family protein [Sediminibacterium sp.]|uniref:acyltransferase family protein n=1 Tax=Sediminibacterium sp. TaxID=1917865 RepID=UPI003F716322
MKKTNAKIKAIWTTLKESKFIESPIRFPGLDGAKGLLVLMVIMTHCLPKSTFLYFMYFFHMPLFMAISGFLVKVSTFKDGFSGYIKRMWSRLIVPWCIASIIFLPFQLNGKVIADFGFADLIYPYYHLWYIPSLLIGAFLCYSILRWNVSVWILLILSAIFSMYWYIVYRDTQLPLKQLPLYWLGDKRLFSYLFFFILGFSLRNKLINVSLSIQQIILLLSISFSVVVFFVFKHYESTALVWPYIIFNTALVIFVLLFIAPNQWLQNKLLLWVNTNSLGFYLYHPLFQTTIYAYIINDKNQVTTTHSAAIGIFLIVFAITSLLIFTLKKFKITNKLILGNIK